MKIQKIQAVAKANFSRFNPNSDKGFYESYFIRANHPTEKKAFWIRYTLFSPKNEAHKRMGELWAVFFDGENIYPHKEEFDISLCKFPDKYFQVEIAENTINSANAVGKAGAMSWNLSFGGGGDPIFFLPLNLYNTPLPKAKSIVSQPNAIFNGEIVVNNKAINIKNWKGSQNHNWGEKHTDYYAWGQVAGFDNSPDTFLEVMTGKLEIGTVETPFLTLLVLRHKGKEYEFNSPAQWLINKGSFDYFEWEFECKNKEIQIKGKIKATAKDFVGLCYHNPAGGDKNCLNSKVASCELEIKSINQKGLPAALYSADKCAFEILTNQDEIHHGIKINF